MDFGSILIYVTCFFGLYTLIYFFMTFYDNSSKLKSPEPERFPTVSVIVPAYNEEKTIAKTLDSLLGLDYPKDKLSIFVIDDGSTDTTYSIAKTYESKGVKVFTKKNEGKGLALNFALKHVTSEFVGALDADSYVDPPALKRIVGFFANPKVMAVTPSMKVWKPSTVLQKIQMIEFLIGIFLRKVFAFLDSIHVTPGPFTIYRKSFFDTYGSYDHSTITEDIEIALRIQSLHFIIENSVDAYVYTKCISKFLPLFKQRIRWYRGFLDNVFRYRHLFSTKYGIMGVFILPASLISVFFVIVSLFYVSYKYTTGFISDLINFYNIGFDWRYYFKFNYDWFTMNFGATVILGAISFIAAIYMINYAKKISDEHASVKFSYVLYLVVYWALFGSWWIVAAYYKATGKKIKWAGRMM